MSINTSIRPYTINDFDAEVYDLKQKGSNTAYPFYDAEIEATETLVEELHENGKDFDRAARIGTELLAITKVLSAE